MIQGFLFWYRYIRILGLLNYVSGSLKLRLNQAASIGKGNNRCCWQQRHPLDAQDGMEVHISTVILTRPGSSVRRKLTVSVSSSQPTTVGTC
jgi:hypothetical protein